MIGANRMGVMENSAFDPAEETEWGLRTRHVAPMLAYQYLRNCIRGMTGVAFDQAPCPVAY